MPEYVIKRKDGKYVSKRQILFRPMQYTTTLKNAARFNNRGNAVLYMQINCYGECRVLKVN